MSVRVIGIGSPYGDDQAGWWVANILEQRQLPEGVEVCLLDRPGPALLQSFEGAEHVVLVDAADFGGDVGEWQALTAESLLLQPFEFQSSGGSHQLGVLETLQVAQACQISLPPMTLYLIQMVSLGASTPEVVNAAQIIAKEIEHKLQLM